MIGMSKRYRTRNPFLLITVTVLFLSLVLSACSSLQKNPIESIAFTESVENYAKAEVVFQVRLPAPIAENEKLVLEILDDVTGVYFNPLHYEMTQQDGLNYFINIPLTVGQKIKYRFLRIGDQTIYEYTTQSKPVRYRMMLVNGPLLMQDSIAAWSDLAYTGPVGRIRGQLIDQETNQPIPNMAIYAAGMQTLSASDGTFILEGLPIWTHNVVISSLDGAYDTFQQGAVISDEATTPIAITLKKRFMTEIEFIVRTPDGFSTDLPLRLATNLYSLGYPDADLPSGSNTISANMPVFTKTSQNEYSLTLSLPVGAELRYKFTFGDGFWNSELNSSGNFVTRELIVNAANKSIRKRVESFTAPGTAEVSFNLTTPDETPANELISLQLGPFGWMQPLPMQKLAQNQWGYTLYSPIHLLGNIDYRFCRNDQCDVAFSNPSQNGSFTASSLPQNITLNLENWENLANTATATTVETNGGALSPRTDFIAGFELVSSFPASWKSSIDQGLQNISSTGANWVIVSPTWTATSTNPPLLEPVIGSDLLWPVLETVIAHVTAQNLQPVLFPVISDASSTDQFWINAKKDAGWWQSTFDRYHRYIIQNADLANVMNASALIVGDPTMDPAMNGGILSTLEPSNVPENADEQWKQLILDIRARYSGPILGVINIPNQQNSIPGWLAHVDGIYVLFSPSLVESGDLSTGGLLHAFNTSLDSLVQPIATQYNKPLIIGINYPATQNSVNGCNDLNGSCLAFSSADLATQTIDLDLQSRIYNAAIISCANRPWVKGFIARGFNPFVVLKDSGSSLYGKPGYDVLWFWYHFILNKSS